MKKSIFIVIAAYNEEKSIGNVVKNLKKSGYKNIVVVDDGSKDKTFEKAKNEKAIVLKHLVNRGQGAALKTGIDYAIKNNAKIIVTFDADGQHQVSDIPKVIKPILNKEVEVTLGSRFLSKESRKHVPFIKKIVLKGGVLFTYLFSGIWLSDAHNGFRALSNNAAKKIEIKQDRMEHASEIVDEIHKKKISFKEIPITIKYTPYAKAKGQSVFNSIKIAFKLIFRKLTN